MSILKVCRLGHPVLREKSRTLPPAILETPAVQTLIDNMIETMFEYHGVGLAAPQIHESLMLTVIESEGSRGKIPLTVLVNPVGDGARRGNDRGLGGLPEHPGFARTRFPSFQTSGRSPGSRRQAHAVCCGGLLCPRHSARIRSPDGSASIWIVWPIFVP
jgi:peptide deformylase